MSKSKMGFKKWLQNAVKLWRRIAKSWIILRQTDHGKTLGTINIYLTLFSRYYHCGT